ncbi:MAG: hypothetical protein M1503_03145 [Thaumarchaeota archaeon]|nr:hypothetical protein [Nitrososphaerota archaeon]MCL5317248.1 hypothetical protein [Nitrososphaerota archaeon]
MQEEAERLPSKSMLPLDTFRVIVIVGLVSPMAFLLYNALPTKFAVPLFATIWCLGFVSDITTTKRFFVLDPENFSIHERNRFFPKLVRWLGFTLAIPIFILIVEVPLAVVATFILSPSYYAITQGLTVGLGETWAGFWAAALMLGIIHFDAALHNYSIERKKKDRTIGKDALA